MKAHVGPYQRPAPPKRPLGLGASKAVQKPAVPMHDIETEARVLLQGMIQGARKPGRPAINASPMTAAERQARRRSIQATERGIQEALRIGDGEGKSREEIKSGGWGTHELDSLGRWDDDDDDCLGGGRSKKVEPKPTPDSGESHETQVRGLQIGDEGVNRCLFAESELRKMVQEYFESPIVNPSAQWIAKHVSSAASHQQFSPSLTLTCKVCGDVMNFTRDAEDHLRVDHRMLIRKWFSLLNPAREFRDMGSFVTVVIPRKGKKRLESED